MPTQISSLYTTQPFKRLFESLIEGKLDPLFIVLGEDHYCCKMCTMKISSAFNPDFFSLYNILKGDVYDIHFDDVRALEVVYDSDVMTIIYKIQRIHNDDERKVPVKHLPDTARENLERLFEYRQNRNTDRLSSSAVFDNSDIVYYNPMTHGKLRRPKYMSENYIKVYINNLKSVEDLKKALVHVVSFDFDDILDILIEHSEKVTPEMLEEMLAKVAKRSLDDNLRFIEFLCTLTDSLEHIDVIIAYCLSKQEDPEICVFLGEIKRRRLQLTRIK